MAEKFTLPTETIELPSQGKVYDITNPLSSGTIEMKYMTAREEDILTNVNLLRQGLAIEKMLQSLIKSPIQYEDLLLGDRNSLLIAARILAYGSAYSFEYTDDENDNNKETVNIDLQSLKNKVVDYNLFNNKNEFSFELPASKNLITFKLLTVGDERKIEQEIKGFKKATNLQAGELTTRLKHQITSVNGEYEQKTIRDFVDNYLLAKDSNPLRAYIASISPDIDLTINFTLSSGREVDQSLPLTAEFFFPGS
jgi:hypothetical protein